MEIVIPDTEKSIAEGNDIVKYAGSLTVLNEDDEQMVTDVISSIIKPALEESAKVFKPLRQTAHAHHRAICAAHDAADAPWKKAESIARKALLDFHAAQRKKQQAQQAKIAADMKRAAEELAAQQVMDKLDAGEDADELINTISKGEVQSLTKPPPLMPRKTSAKQSSVSITLKYKVTDITKVNRRFLMVDDAKITAEIRNSKKEAETTVGGIEIYEQDSLRIRKS